MEADLVRFLARQSAAGRLPEALFEAVDRVHLEAQSVLLISHGVVVAARTPFLPVGDVPALARNVREARVVERGADDQLFGDEVCQMVAPFGAGAVYLGSPREGAFRLEHLRILDCVVAVADELSRLEERSAELALRDNLTGLGTHTAFQVRLADAVERGVPFAVALFNVDHLRNYNLTFGYPAGDRLLREVAEVLGGLGFVARYSGGEFAALLPGLDLEHARNRCEQARAEVERRYPHLVGLSAGVAASPPRQTAREVLKGADDALYVARRSGRNRVILDPQGDSRQ
jgi:diguanylate cyclase (GGDEF)-like protein